MFGRCKLCRIWCVSMLYNSRTQVTTVLSWAVYRTRQRLRSLSDDRVVYYHCTNRDIVQRILYRRAVSINENDKKTVHKYYKLYFFILLFECQIDGASDGARGSARLAARQVR